jgi:hypothetical protein
VKSSKNIVVVVVLVEVVVVVVLVVVEVVVVVDVLVVVVLVVVVVVIGKFSVPYAIVALSKSNVTVGVLATLQSQSIIVTGLVPKPE